jgi:D-xylose transport system ATP-binding protein
MIAEASRSTPILEARDITKRFGSVVALQNVSLEIFGNEIVGLVGDNGAGKSTLIKIISGNFQPDQGSILFDGSEVHLRNPSDARGLGIETVYQDLSLCNNLDAVSNLFIGRELCRSVLRVKVIQKREMTRISAAVLSKVGITLPSIHEKMEFLSGGQRQAVALGRFVAWGTRLILLDEPTSAIGVRETGKVLELIKRSRKEETGIIMISHNLPQIFEVATRIVVLRHGEVVGVRDKEATSPDEIVSMITGAIEVSRGGS